MSLYIKNGHLPFGKLRCKEKYYLKIVKQKNFVKPIQLVNLLAVFKTKILVIKYYLLLIRILKYCVSQAAPKDRMVSIKRCRISPPPPPEKNHPLSEDRKSQLLGLFQERRRKEMLLGLGKN